MLACYRTRLDSLCFNRIYAGTCKLLKDACLRENPFLRNKKDVGYPDVPHPIYLRESVNKCLANLPLNMSNVQRPDGCVVWNLVMAKCDWCLPLDGLCVGESDVLVETKNEALPVVMWAEYRK